MKPTITYLLVFLILFSPQFVVDRGNSNQTFLGHSSLFILEAPERLSAFDGFVVSLEVVVLNNRSESVNVTLAVEQDRSPHQAIPIEPIPVITIPARLTGVLMLELVPQVSYDILPVEEWIGSVATSVFIRAVAVDNGERSPPVMVEVNIFFLRIRNVTVPLLLGAVLILTTFMLHHRWKLKRQIAPCP